MYGDLALGEPVSEDRLAGLLGVSRTPVREALSALAMQGLIEIKPQRGSFVFQPSAAAIKELCEFRAIVEVQAMRLAHARAADATVAALSAADHDLRGAAARGDVVGAARADAAYHDAFVTHCGNGLLEQAYLLVSGRVGAIRFRARTSGGSRAASSLDHQAMIASFRAGDLAATEATLTDHIMRMQRHFEERDLPA